MGVAPPEGARHVDRDDVSAGAVDEHVLHVGQGRDDTSGPIKDRERFGSSGLWRIDEDTAAAQPRTYWIPVDSGSRIVRSPSWKVPPAA